MGKNQIDRLKSILDGYKEKYIAVYGTGAMAKEVIEGLQEFSKIVVLDSFRDDGYFTGEKIINVEEFKLLDVEVVLIAAKPINVPTIAEHVLRISHRENLLLIDSFGNDLRKIMKKICEEKCKYYRKSAEDLKAKIRDYDVISFDIFDTLLMRKTLNPGDIYELVDWKMYESGKHFENFAQNRIRAEKEIESDVPDIHAIYVQLQKNTGISDEEREFIKKFEMQTEKENLVVRTEMAEVLRYAAALGKEVHLISDMHFPEAVLDNFLKDLKIEGYIKIWVSCDYGKTKYSGLYQCYRQSVTDGRLLHIGDNVEADGFYPLLNGMDIYLIKSAKEMLRNSSYWEVLGMVHSLNERSLVGLFAAKVFNDPFRFYKTDGRPKIHSIYEVGYLFVAPILSGFMIWFLQRVRKYDRVLLGARDGFLIEKLYRIAVEELKLKEMPEAVYLLVSRMVCIGAGMNTDQDILWMLSPPYSCSAEQILKERFGLEDEEIQKYDRTLFPDDKEYVVAHREAIFRHANQLRSNYLKYIDSLCLDKNRRYAFFDFVSCGTSQFFLQKIVPFKLDGIYCGTYCPVSGEERNLNIDAYIKNPDYYRKESYFFENYLFIENIMSSYMPTLVSIEEEGVPVYGSECRSAEEFYFMSEMHRAIIDFFTDFVKYLYVFSQDIDWKIVDKLFSYKDSAFSNTDGIGIENLTMVDDFGKNILRI